MSEVFQSAPVQVSATYSEAAIAELLYLLEEEKLAGDVYEAFFDIYGLQTFDNIARSEDQHFSALLQQARSLGLDVDAILAQPAGSYDDPDLQALYDTLLAQGSQSLADAVDVGIRIELTDIEDLQTASALVEGTALASVYDNLLAGSQRHLDAFQGLDADPHLFTGTSAADSLTGTEGADTLNGDAGDDVLIGGVTETDVRDVIYGGEGDDSIDGGYGNDELRGDAGNDTITGGYGADTVIGGDGDDVLTGQAWSDEIFGGDGADFINGGFGFDRLNGGAGADRFYHAGIADHGADWIQDYTASEGDVLQFGADATADQFQVNFSQTANAGTEDVDEAFVIYRPTGQIIWALVDGAGQSEINLMLGGDTFDLLG